MEFILALSVMVLGLIAFNVAAVAWGVDSRERLGDDFRI